MCLKRGSMRASNTVFLGADHAGFFLKEFLETRLREAGYATRDFGAFSCDPDDDYPDIIARVAKAIAENPDTRGIIMGGSGQGEAMEANRTRGVRAAVFYGGPRSILTLSREHNDANVLSLGARFLTNEEAWEAVRLWLETQFSDAPRHARRIRKLDV